VEVNFKFVNDKQREFYYSTHRNQCLSGGFNNGKTFGCCLKIITLLLTFPNYRVLVCRQVRSDLMKTTYQTFMKIVPPAAIARNNEQEGVTVLVNGSTIFWIHLDKVDESTLRGLEINTVFVDQAEETDEKVYDVLDARVGRWDKAEIPKEYLEKYPNWPKNLVTEKYIAPSYMILACNPDTQFHYIFRKYHPDSVERDPGYFFISCEWDPNLGSKETYEQALKRGEEYVAKYVRGEWGRSSAQIHRLSSKSYLEYDQDFLSKILQRGNLFRSMDHGETSPTCCLWSAGYQGNLIFYREYYTAKQLISFHRAAIVDLSGEEKYSASYADPSIFHRASQKNGGYWSVADEYLSRDITGPQIVWMPADNNEFATRNRINEFLFDDPTHVHPITGEKGAPRIYFIKRDSVNYPNGCHESIKQLQAQRRKLIGYVNGESIYSDDREDGVTDHAYDPVRYIVAMHGSTTRVEKTKVKENTLDYYNQLLLNKKRKSLTPASYGSNN